MEGLVIIVLPAVVVAAASIGIVRSAVYVHDTQGEAIRQRVKQPFLLHKIPAANPSQPLSMVYEYDNRLSRVTWKVAHLNSRTVSAPKSQAILFKLNRVQREYLALLDRICNEALPQRPSRAYRNTVPNATQNATMPAFADDVFKSAKQLARDGRNQIQSPLQPSAKRLMEKYDVLREILYQQSLRNCTKYTLEVKDALMSFEDAYVNFEENYLVSPPSDLIMSTNQGQLTVILAEAVRLAMKHGLIEQEDIDSMEPSLFFVVPRLALVFGLYYTDAIKLDSRSSIDVFRNQLTELSELKKRLRNLGESAVRELEKALADKIGEDDDSQVTVMRKQSDESSSGSSGSNSGGGNETLPNRFRRYFTKKVATDDLDSVPQLFIDLCNVADHMHSGNQVRILRNSLREVFDAYQLQSSARAQELERGPLVPTGNILRVTARTREILSGGAVFNKISHNPRARPHKRFIWLADNLKEILWCQPEKNYSPKPSRISVDSILSVTKEEPSGPKTRNKKGEPLFMMRITTINRNVDLLANEETCNEWVPALQELMMAMPARPVSSPGDLPRIPVEIGNSLPDLANIDVFG